MSRLFRWWWWAELRARYARGAGLVEMGWEGFGGSGPVLGNGYCVGVGCGRGWDWGDVRGFVSFH